MKRLVLALLIGALPVTVANAAPAPTVQEALDACRALENPLDRLACYDSIPGASVTGGAATTPAEAPADVTDGEVPGPLFGTPHDTPFLRSRMTRRWELDDATHGGLFRVRRHEPVYALPARFSTSPNERPVSPTLGVADGERLDAIEAKFQVSLKTKVWNDLVEDNGDVWVGFTQQSNWQAYNDIDSSPFRETNYSPEVWTTWRTGVDLPLMRWQMLNLGFVHQSNGQGGARSRSWNRVYATLGFERGDWELYVRPWLRVEPPGIDDNPDIEDFYGHGDVRLVWRGARHDVGLTARLAADEGRGALQFDWHYPLIGDLKAYLQIFTGYGESLIDYNHRQTTIGLGVSLVQ